MLLNRVQPIRHVLFNSGSSSAAPEQLRVAGVQLAPQLAAAGVEAHFVAELKALLQPQGAPLGASAAPAVPAASGGRRRWGARAEQTGAAGQARSLSRT